MYRPVPSDIRCFTGIVIEGKVYDKTLLLSGKRVVLSIYSSCESLDLPKTLTKLSYTVFVLIRGQDLQLTGPLKGKDGKPTVDGTFSTVIGLWGTILFRYDIPLWTSYSEVHLSLSPVPRDSVVCVLTSLIEPSSRR